MTRPATYRIEIPAVLYLDVRAGSEEEATRAALDIVHGLSNYGPAAETLHLPAKLHPADELAELDDLIERHGFEDRVGSASIEISAYPLIDTTEARVVDITEDSE